MAVVPFSSPSHQLGDRRSERQSVEWHAPAPANAAAWGRPGTEGREGGTRAAAEGTDRKAQTRRWRILPAEAELLTHAARTILDEHGIDDPLQWAPRLAPTALRPLTLPSPDPDSITVARRRIFCEHLPITVGVGSFLVGGSGHRS
jgi:hypothetical protein